MASALRSLARGVAKERMKHYGIINVNRKMLCGDWKKYVPNTQQTDK